VSDAADALPPHARVLIVRLGALGDIVHALPVLAALRSKHPTITVDWLVDARYVSVLRLVDGVRQRIVVRAREPGDNLPDELRFVGRAGVLAALRHLRAQQYHAAVDLQGLIKSAVFARGAGARRVIGFDAENLREPVARVAYTEQVPAGHAVHVIDKNLVALRAFGMAETARQFPWRTLASPVVEGVRTLPPVSDGDGFVLLNPGAAWVNKRWSPAKFGALARGLRDEWRVTSVVTWAPDEESLAHAVVSASAGAAVAAPPTALPDLLALAQHARLVVSGDTGPLHLAASVGAPIVALFGPTLPARNGPWHADDIAVSRASTCACLYKRRCLRGQACIDDIAVEDVLDACARRLQVPGVSAV
jgi:heptosyltransferase I